MNYLCAEPGEPCRASRPALTREQKREFSKPECIRKTRRCLPEYDRAFEKLDRRTLEVLEMFETGWDIITSTDYDIYNIIRVCEGKRKSQAGYVWRYKK